MHHLFVNPGGGGGCQVNGTPPGCLSLLLLTVFSVLNYASVNLQTGGIAGAVVSDCLHLMGINFFL